MAVKLNGPASGLDPKAKDGDVLAFNKKDDQWVGDSTVKQRISAVETGKVGTASAPLRTVNGEVGLVPGTADGAVLRWDAAKTAWVQDITILDRLAKLEKALAVIPPRPVAPPAPKYPAGSDAAVYGDMASALPRAEATGTVYLGYGTWRYSTLVADRAETVTRIRLKVTRGSSPIPNSAGPPSMTLYSGPGATKLTRIGSFTMTNIKSLGYQEMSLPWSVALQPGQLYVAILQVPSDGGWAESTLASGKPKTGVYYGGWSYQYSGIYGPPTSQNLDLSARMFNDNTDNRGDGECFWWALA